MIHDITLFLILGGAIVMFLAVWETRRLLTLTKDNRYHRAWKILLALMVFFLFGYVAVGGLLFLGIDSFLKLLTGAIFFFGAIFVLLTVKTGLLTFQDFIRLSRERYALEQSKEQAEAIAKVRSEFLMIISHELRTPLNAMLGFAQLLETTQPTENQRDCIQAIHKGGDQLLSIIDKVLILAQPDTEQSARALYPCCVTEVVEQVIAIATPSVPSGVQVDCQFDSQLPHLVKMDSQRFQNILTQLVDNALKFTTAGEVEILVNCPTSQALTITVRDTGIGIPLDQQQTIFQPFAQVDTAINREQEGLGLGLSLVQKWVAQMGGDIWVNSTPQEGSIFGFTIPFEETSQIDIFSIS